MLCYSVGAMLAAVEVDVGHVLFVKSVAYLHFEEEGRRIYFVWGYMACEVYLQL